MNHSLLNSTDLIFLMSYNLKLVREVHVRALYHFFSSVLLYFIFPPQMLEE